eukprot:536355-Pyramimonas_sp.AAC.1
MFKGPTTDGTRANFGVSNGRIILRRVHTAPSIAICIHQVTGGRVATAKGRGARDTLICHGDLR